MRWIMTTWFTADTHFDHAAILRHCNRPFDNTSDMSDAFFEHTNASLSRGDQVWHLGDFCWRASNVGRWLARFRRGVQVHVVLGNHDAKSLRKYASSSQDMAYRKFRLEGSNDTLKIHMTHYPLYSWRARAHGSYHLYGHSHGTAEDALNKISPGRLAMDVGVDVSWKVLGEWRPFSLEEVVAIIRGRNEL